MVLRIWNSSKNGGEGWGHSSLEVGGGPPSGIYITWWPENLNLMPGFAENKSLSHDFRVDGPPSAAFDLTGLDERAIKVWWTKWRGSSMIYSGAGKNCSSTVAKALKAGGADQFAKAAGWSEPAVWKPHQLADYARAIRTGQEIRKRLAHG